MISNSDGDGILEQEMAAFDALPKTVRRALANANTKFEAFCLYEYWRDRLMTAREIVQEIRDVDKCTASSTPGT